MHKRRWHPLRPEEAAPQTNIAAKIQFCIPGAWVGDFMAPSSLFWACVGHAFETSIWITRLRVSKATAERAVTIIQNTEQTKP